MKPSYLFFSVSLLISAEALAQLSDNPWLEPNNEEEIIDVYKKKNKRVSGLMNYNEEEMIELENISQEILPDEEKIKALNEKKPAPKKEGLLDTVKSLLVSNDNEQQESPSSSSTSSSNSRQMLSADTDEENYGSDILNKLNLDRLKNSMPVNLKKPNVNSWIHKFEKASGVDLKAIGRKLKKYQ